MPTREEMINAVVDDYKKDPLYQENAEFRLRLEFYQTVMELKDLMKQILEKMG
ncbi:MAG: hypothetical protein ACXV4B_09130 [Halobacteriota archaeon]